VNEQRIIEQLDAMVASGRITQEEAAHFEQRKAHPSSVSWWEPSALVMPVRTFRRPSLPVR
jgi:hypothetical protein